MQRTAAHTSTDTAFLLQQQVQTEHVTVQWTEMERGVNGWLHLSCGSFPWARERTDSVWWKTEQSAWWSVPKDEETEATGDWDFLARVDLWAREPTTAYLSRWGYEDEQPHATCMRLLMQVAEQQNIVSGTLAGTRWQRRSGGWRQLLETKKCERPFILLGRRRRTSPLSGPTIVWKSHLPLQYWRRRQDGIEDRQQKWTGLKSRPTWQMWTRRQSIISFHIWGHNDSRGSPKLLPSYTFLEHVWDEQPDWNIGRWLNPQEMSMHCLQIHSIPLILNGLKSVLTGAKAGVWIPEAPYVFPGTVLASSGLSQHTLRNQQKLVKVSEEKEDEEKAAGNARPIILSQLLLNWESPWELRPWLLMRLLLKKHTLKQIHILSIQGFQNKVLH